MASPLDSRLSEELARLEARGLHRRLDRLGRIAGPGESSLIDFTSNDVLGFSRHPDVVEGARRGLEEAGAGGRASRLLGGGSEFHIRAEAAVARWLGEESALLFASGYQANLGLITSLAGPGDAIVSDELNHASLIDAARLSGARLFITRHADPDDVRRALGAAAGAQRRIVVTEGIFSMDGDLAPLPDLARACAEGDAWLVVDEAHAAGVIGPGGRGAWAAAKVTADAPGADRLLARLVTGSKALGGGGAAVAGSAALIETLVNRARSFIFSTAPPPAVAGALTAAIALLEKSDVRRARVVLLASRLASRLGLPAPAGAIVPVVIGTAGGATRAMERLRAQGFDVRAVRPPAVPEGSSRLRLVVHCDQSENEIDRLADAIREFVPGKADASAPASISTPGVGSAPGPRRVVFVVGTDTGVGKTTVSAALWLAARESGSEGGRGEPVYWKPVQTGPDDDTATVARLTGGGKPGFSPALASPVFAFPLAGSPHAAAEAAGGRIDDGLLDRRFVELLASGDGPSAGDLIVELAGGLIVPMNESLTQADWLVRHGRPPARIVLVARSGLGTLNHTLLTIEALRARRLAPCALVLVGERHESNFETLGRMAGVERIYQMPLLVTPGPDTLAAWIEVGRLKELF